MSILIMLVVAVALSIVAYMLTPKPKQPKPAAAQDLESPTAEAGRPVPVVFGTMTMKGVNLLWYGDKQVRQYQVKS